MATDARASPAEARYDAEAEAEDDALPPGPEPDVSSEADRALLLEAISLWQQTYAERPRFSLQGFVSELCQMFDLGERRHQIHMSGNTIQTIQSCEHWEIIQQEKDHYRIQHD